MVNCPRNYIVHNKLYIYINKKNHILLLLLCAHNVVLALLIEFSFIHGHKFMLRGGHLSS